MVLVARADRDACIPMHPSQRVSHNTIYVAIYAQPWGGLKALMIEALWQVKPKRGARRNSLAGSPMAPETLRISIIRKTSKRALFPATGRET